MNKQLVSEKSLTLAKGLSGKLWERLRGELPAEQFEIVSAHAALATGLSSVDADPGAVPPDTQGTTFGQVLIRAWASMPSEDQRTMANEVGGVLWERLRVELPAEQFDLVGLYDALANCVRYVSGSVDLGALDPAGQVREYQGVLLEALQATPLPAMA